MVTPTGSSLSAYCDLDKQLLKGKYSHGHQIPPFDKIGSDDTMGRGYV